MNRVNIQNLALEITNKCNLECENCINKNENNEITMSSEIINSTFSQINRINNLHIYGGEPTLVLNKMVEIFQSIIAYHIKLDQLLVTTNGSCYQPELIELLNYIDLYGKYASKKLNVKFNILRDEHHKKALRELGMYQEALLNIKKYMESNYFNGFIKEPNVITKSNNFSNIYVTYMNKMKLYSPKNGICYIGPIITVNPKGIITECDASIEEQETLYNYGNVVTDSIEEIALERGKVLKPIEWYNETYRAIR